MKMSVWGCILAVMVVEAAAVGVVEKVSVVLGSHTELDCGEGAGILWTRVSSDNSEADVDTADEHFQFAVVEDEDENEEEDRSRLTLLKIHDDHLGVYRCKTESGAVLKEFQVDAAVKVSKMARSTYVSEGADTRLHCALRARPRLVEDRVVFRWFLASEEEEEEESSRVELRPSEHRGQEPASLEERAEITSEDSSSVLTITSAMAGDRRRYICRVELESGDCSDPASPHCDETATLLRVKDPLAILYPAAGILAQLVVLVVVIYYCEVRRQKDIFLHRGTIAHMFQQIQMQNMMNPGANNAQPMKEEAGEPSSKASLLENLPDYVLTESSTIVKVKN